LVESVVDTVGRALSTSSIDGVETSDTSTGESSKVKLFVISTSGSADSSTGVIEARSNAVGADTSDQEKVRKAGADIADELLVKTTLGNGLYWGLHWRGVLESALSLD
jgi:hypothetical protein